MADRNASDDVGWCGYSALAGKPSILSRQLPTENISSQKLRRTARSENSLIPNKIRQLYLKVLLTTFLSINLLLIVFGRRCNERNR